MRLKLSLAFCLLATAALADSTHAERRPNIVLMLVDDMSHKALGVYGGASYQTPNCDRMAAEGLRFNNCFACPLCTPSRTQLMTGLHGDRNYAGGRTLDDSQVTFADLLHDAGYATCIIGKWKFNHGAVSRPEAFGFDQYLCSQVVSEEKYKDAKLALNGRVEQLTNGEYGPDAIRNFGLKFIEQNAAKPFLLYYSMILVHDPHTPTPDSPRYAENKDDVINFPDMVRYMTRTWGRCAPNSRNWVSARTRSSSSPPITAIRKSTR